MKKGDKIQNKDTVKDKNINRSKMDMSCKDNKNIINNMGQ
jgi:hypothetical protein